MSGRGYKFFDGSHTIDLKRSVPSGFCGVKTNVLKSDCRHCSYDFAEWCIAAKDGDTEGVPVSELAEFRLWKARQAGKEPQ